MTYPDEWASPSTFASSGTNWLRGVAAFSGAHASRVTVPLVKRIHRPKVDLAAFVNEVTHTHALA